MRKYLFLMLFAVSFSVSGGVYVTISSGDWDNSANWLNGMMAPQNGNNNVIVIASGNVVMLNNDISFGNGCELYVNGSLVINGDLTALNSLVIHVTGNLVINGSVEVKNGGVISITGDLTVSGNVEFSNNGTINMNTGYLDIGGNLSGSTGGEITGSGVIDIGGINTFDTTPSTGVTVNAGLPVSLIEFYAQCENNYVAVHWTTASEINCAFFTLERSSDMQLWSSVSQISGAGNSNTLMNYSYTDLLPLSGESYYRLIQTDFDGQVEIFGPVSVNSSNDAAKVSVFPNPFIETLVISFSDEVPETGSIILSDSKGSVVFRSVYNNENMNSGEFPLDMTAVPAGIYYLTISAEGFSQTSEIMKEL